MSNSLNFKSGIYDGTGLSISQAAKLNKDNLVPELSDPSDDFGIGYKLNSLTPTAKLTFKHYLESPDDCGVSYDSQGWIGNKIGRRRQGVCEEVGVLGKCGLLNVLGRTNKTNIVVVNPRVLKDNTLRNVLAKFLPCLNTVLIFSTLLACPQALSEEATSSLTENRTQNIKSLRNIYNPLTKSISNKKTYICKRGKSVLKVSETDRNVPAARNTTPEERRQQMRIKRDEDLLTLFKQGDLTREQVEQAIKNRRD